MNPSNSTIARLGYISIVCFVLSFIASGIHKKAYQAVAPPIYDPISYYSKSQIVWDAISHNRIKSAFDQFPQRPPGTALILYPFGFVNSIQSFLFRSTFAPIAIWALALLVIILPKIRDLNEMISGAALTTGLLSLPIFYHFEFPISSERAFGISLQWGLVDVLQGSVGALAVVLLFTGIRKRIRTLTVLGWLIGAYTFFIKPSGVLVLGCLFLVYITEALIYIKQQKHLQGKIIYQLLALFCLGISITVCSIWLAVSSGYLSKEVIASAQIGQKLFLEMVQHPLMNQIGLLVSPVLGCWLAFPIIMVLIISGVIFIYSLFKWRYSDLSLRFMMSLLIFSAALYWWLTMAGQEHRYLFPFIMIIMSWIIVPTLFDWMACLKNGMRYLAIIYCAIPIITIVLLLYIPQGNASAGIEKFFGCNLDSGQYNDEVNMGKYLLRESVKKQRPIRIYSIGNYRVGAVDMVDWVNSIEGSIPSRNFTTFRVNDWMHPGIQVRQLLSCDYFIVEKGFMKGQPRTDSVLNWRGEEYALTYFITSCEEKPESGIKLIQQGAVSLFEVVNREKFAAECNKWIASLTWSDDFWVRNSYARGDFGMPGLKVINPKVVDDLFSKNASVLPVIDFGHKMTLLALLRNTENDSLKSGDVLLTFLFRADQEIPIKYTIFIHLMDKDKKVIFQHDFQIEPDGGIIPKGTIWKSLLPIPKSELAKSVFLGFGAYIPNKADSFLKSNFKDSDWNSNRVLMRLNP